MAKASEQVAAAPLVGGGETDQHSHPGAGASLTVSETEVFNGTSPTAWTDLDLSGTIGSQVTLVLLKGVTTPTHRWITFRRDGDTDDFRQASSWGYGVAGADQIQGRHGVYLVATSSSGVIEWITESAAAWVLDIIAYIK